MPSEFTMTHRVEFAETDLAGIMHFANFFRWMERTEHAFLRSLGHSVHERQGDRRIGWPRVRVLCEYRQPLRFEDEVEVRLLVREKRDKSLRYEFVFRKVGEPADVARGEVTTVCVALPASGDDGARLTAVFIPASLAAQIQVAADSSNQERRVELADAGISAAEAAELRRRLGGLDTDWEREDMSVYDELTP